jgi:L-alanine-DL-glutamate epimerase-like enolase superfamily enzyme
MRIKKLHAYNRCLPITRPYTITRNTFTEANIVFFEVELENGMKGTGSSNTDKNVVGEDANDTLQNLLSPGVQQLVNKDIREFQSLIHQCRVAFAKFPGTQAAIDIALHDAFCRFIGISVLDFYGRQHEKLRTSVTIGIKNVSETITEAQEYFDRGFRALKVKTGLNLEEDIERIILLREKFGNYFDIRVDANAGYNPEQLRSFINNTKQLNVDLIEQPLLPGGEDELLKLKPEERALLAADESLKDARSALTLASSTAYGIFNIKLMKCGGLKGAFEIANIAHQAGISLFWGCNDESIASITAALHAAYACANTRYIDLDGSFDLASDVVRGGFEMRDGYLLPNERPGFGFELIN